VQFVAKKTVWINLTHWSTMSATNYTNYHEQQSVKIRVIRGKRTNHTLRHQPPDSHEFHELPRKRPRIIRVNSCNSWQKEISAIRGRVTDMTNIVVIGMGYVGIPCAALLADVPGFSVTGIQRRSLRCTPLTALGTGRTGRALRLEDRLPQWSPVGTKS
jgi:hypothetical protein